MKHILSILLACLFTNILFATATIKGTIKDQESGEALPFVTLSLLQNGTPVNGVTTDIDGRYEFASISAGTYEIKCQYVGYMDKITTGIVLKDGETKVLDIEMSSGMVTMDEVVVTAHKERQTKSLSYAVQSVSGEKITRLPASRPKGRKKSKPSPTAPTSALAGKMAPRTPPPPPAPRDAKPQVHNTEDYSPIVENNFKEVKNDPLSTFSIDVDRASYSNIRRYITSNQLPPKDAVRIEEMVNYFDYDYPKPTDEHPFKVITEMSECPWSKENQLVHIGLQGKEIDLEKAPNTNLVFLLDVSGSMGSANKLPLLKSALKLLVNNLRQEYGVCRVCRSCRPSTGIVSRHSKK